MQPSRRFTADRSRSAILPRIPRPSRHRVSIEFAEIPRVPRLVPDSAARRVGTDGGGPRGEGPARGGWSRRSERAVRASGGGWMRRRVPPGVHSSGVLPEPVHTRQLAKRIPAARSHALPYAGPNNNDPLLPPAAAATGTSANALPRRRLHQNDYVYGVTRVRARLHTRARTARSRSPSGETADGS